MAQDGTGVFDVHVLFLHSCLFNFQCFVIFICITGCLGCECFFLPSTPTWDVFLLCFFSGDAGRFCALLFLFCVASD